MAEYLCRRRRRRRFVVGWFAALSTLFVVVMTMMTTGTTVAAFALQNSRRGCCKLPTTSVAFGLTLHHHSSSILFMAAATTTRTSDRNNNNNNNSTEAASTIASTSSGVGGDDDVVQEVVAVPDCVVSPALQQVYPAMMKFYQQYGHANIPLPEGRMCYTLRRLHIQQKLTEEEVQLLRDNLNFTFSTMQDCYVTLDFDDMIQRLENYEAEHQTNYQIPKKYKPDPELGAWVTGLRRLGPNSTEILPQHKDRLNALGFPWKSTTRLCGSKFMQQYRSLVERLEEGAYSQHKKDANADSTTVAAIWKEPETIAWIQAQRQAHAKGTLSTARYHYMEQLFKNYGPTVITTNDMSWP